MKNKSWIILIIVFIAILIGMCFYFYIDKRKNNNTSNYKAARNLANEASNNTSNIVMTKNTTEHEEEIASFSTQIYSKDSSRQNNISITCSTLNDTIVENGSLFSFCDIVGKATSDKGYQEADIFDKNGNKIKGLGGGNCQISTTLYNAVLKIPELSIVERHEHSNYVPYIEEGKDAAVAYGSYDFKFQNNTGNKVKIKVNSSNSSVTVKLLKIV